MGHDWQQLIDQLRGAEYQFGVHPGASVHHVEFDVGLSDTELISAERKFGFRFPAVFQDVRWEDGSCVFDNRKDLLPT